MKDRLDKTGRRHTVQQKYLKQCASRFKALKGEEKQMFERRADRETQKLLRTLQADREHLATCIQLFEARQHELDVAVGAVNTLSRRRFDSKDLAFLEERMASSSMD
eukprot:5928500-Alexandrium_andersonii.AAC.1